MSWEDFLQSSTGIDPDNGEESIGNIIKEGVSAVTDRPSEPAVSTGGIQTASVNTVDSNTFDTVNAEAGPFPDAQGFVKRNSMALGIAGVVLVVVLIVFMMRRR